MTFLHLAEGSLYIVSLCYSDSGVSAGYVYLSDLGIIRFFFSRFYLYLENLWRSYPYIYVSDMSGGHVYFKKNESE